MLLCHFNVGLDPAEDAAVPILSSESQKTSDDRVDGEVKKFRRCHRVSSNALDSLHVCRQVRLEPTAHIKIDTAKFHHKWRRFVVGVDGHPETRLDELQDHRYGLYPERDFVENRPGGTTVDGLHDPNELPGCGTTSENTDS